MYSACRVIAFCGFSLAIGYGQNTNPAASQLEAMERFASKTTAQVVWSKEIGRIGTDQGHAVITALIVQDGTQTPRQMRGVRIEMTGANLKDQVYTSEDLLGRLIQALDEISNGLPDFHSRVAAGRSSCFGSGVFWQQGGHAFSASQGCRLLGLGSLWRRRSAEEPIGPGVLSVAAELQERRDTAA